MRDLRLGLLIAVLFLTLAYGPAAEADPPGGVNTSRKGARRLPLPKEEGVFHFLIFGDRTGSPASSIHILEQAVGEANLLSPDLVLTVGDLINGYNKRPEWLEQMQEYRGVMDRLEMPWFPVPGNHDVYWGGSRAPKGHHESDYEANFGPLWYWFGHKNTAFIALYSDEGDRARNRKGWGEASVNRFSKEQLQWLGASLKDMKAYDHVFVFMHHPRWDTGYYPGSNWEKVHDLLKKAGNVHAVFAGHIHRQRYDGKKDGIEYFTLATTGGRLPFDVPGTGYLHHMNLVTVRQGKVSIATVPLGSVLDPREMTRERWQDVDRLRGLALGFEKEGIRLHATGGARGRWRFTVKNPCERPVAVTVQPRAEDRAWWFAPSHLHVELQPGETKGLTLEYGRDAEDDLEHLGLPLLGLQADYLAESMRIALPERTVVAPWSLASIPGSFFEASADSSLVLAKGACLKIPAKAIRIPDGPFAIEGWLKADTLKGRRAFLAKTESSDYGIFVSDGRPSFSVYLGNGYATASVQKPILETGRWHHVAGVFDGSEVHLYVDGRRVASAPAEGKRRMNSKPLYVGADPDKNGRPTSHFVGRIDEVRISKGVRYDRTSFEPKRRFTPDKETLLLLHLDRALGPIAVDCSSGRCHATRVGEVVYR